MTTPSAEVDVQSKATAFMWRRPVLWSLHRLAHSASAGFILTAPVVWLANRAGEPGRQGAAMLQELMNHSIPNKAVYTFSVGLLAVSMVANRVLAQLVRKWLAKPMIELAAHTVSVAFGAVVALLVSAIYVGELRPKVGPLAGALLTLAIVFFVLQLSLWIAKGRLDKLLTSHSLIELASVVAAFAVGGAALHDLSDELLKAGEHHEQCSSTAKALPSSDAPITSSR